MRYRRVIFALIAGFGLLGFNGQWMVERDTSLFRGLGHSLATGKGYVFGEFATKQVYPGLPFILAGLEKVFGETALPPLILMNLMAFGVLYFTYRLMRLHFPEWIAIAVTAGVGINATFLEMTQQIMTDVPFMLGVVVFLYGWERMRLARSYRQVAIAGLAFLLPGLVLSLSMRPTCWVLALACLLVCVWGVIAGPRRRFYATCLAMVVFGALVFFFIDPRTRGFNPLGGGYERDLLATIHQLGSVVTQEMSELLNKQLTAGFFGGRFGTGLTQAMALIVIGSTWFLFRRGFPLWGLLVLLTIAVTLVTESIPRYYLMVLPLMVLAYVLCSAALARRMGRVWGERLFIVAVGMLLVPNIVRHVAFIYEQHWDDPGLRKKWADPIIAAQMVKDFVPEDARIIGPQAPIIAYLSGRSVYMQKELFSAHENPINYPKRIAAKGIEYMILPATKYNHSEPIMAQLVERGVIVPTARVTRDSGLTLAMVDIIVPPEGKDWRKNPIANHQWVTTTQRGPTSDQVRRMTRLRREAAEARVRREKLELKQKLEAKRVREANAAKLAKAAKERQAQLAAKKAREARLAREAKARQAANARKKRLQQATQPSAIPQLTPTTQPTSFLSPLPVRGDALPPHPIPPRARGEGAVVARHGDCVAWRRGLS